MIIISPRSDVMVSVRLRMPTALNSLQNLMKNNAGLSTIYIAPQCEIREEEAFTGDSSLVE